tara:strand:+ start:142 stop:345 length:204 start_codon:yes stop_codon:yes gene_type:complete
VILLKKLKDFKVKMPIKGVLKTKKYEASNIKKMLIKQTVVIKSFGNDLLSEFIKYNAPKGKNVTHAP